MNAKPFNAKPFNAKPFNAKPTECGNTSIRRIGVGALVILVASALAAATSIADTLCTACIDTGSDDGAELVIAVPGETRGSDTEAGLAHLLVDGTTTVTLGEGRDLGDATINGTPEDGDMFASALASADFNGDGFDDIAIGVPLEDVGRTDDAGVVIVLLSDSGTGALNESMVLKQGTNGFPGSPDEGDNFGFSLSSQDFGFNDGFDDLIIGVPGEDIDGAVDAGQVHVVMGSADGPDPSDVETWHQDVPGINGGPEAGDMWGYSVAGSSVGDESWGTLIVGAPFEDVGDIADAGIVQVIYSESSGLTATGDQIWHQDTADIRGNAEAGDHFGMTLAVGDFGSGYDDLAIGVPGEDTGSTVDAGIVQIINGDFNGLVASGNSVLKQGAGQIEGTREANDRFGAALATVPVGSEDVLAIGAPGETLGGNTSAGSVHLRFPMAEDSIGIVTIHQNKPGVKGSNETGDEFGFAIDYGDVNNDGHVDLIVGGPGEDNNAGKVWVFYGSVEGFSGDDDTFRQGKGAFGGSKEAGDRFGAVVLGSRR